MRIVGTQKQRCLLWLAILQLRSMLKHMKVPGREKNESIRFTHAKTENYA